MTAFNFDEFMAELEADFASGKLVPAKTKIVKSKEGKLTKQLLDAKVPDPVSYTLVAVIEHYLQVNCQCGCATEFLQTRRVELKANKSGITTFAKVDTFSKQELEKLPTKPERVELEVMECENCSVLSLNF